MVFWIIIIIAAAIFQYVVIAFNIPRVFLHISSVAMVISLLGIVYHLYSWHRSGLTLKRDRKRGHELLGEIMRREGYCDAESILKALNNQSRGDLRLMGEILVDMNVLDKEKLNKALMIQKEEDQKD